MFSTWCDKIIGVIEKEGYMSILAVFSEDNDDSLCHFVKVYIVDDEDIGNADPLKNFAS